MAYSQAFASAKDPSEVWDLDWDFGADLADDETVADHTVAATGVTVNSSAVNGTRIVARVSGGTAGADAEITFHITTSTGQEFERTGLLRIREL